MAEANLREIDGPMSATVTKRTEADFVSAWPKWSKSWTGHAAHAIRPADPVAFYRSSVSLVAHSATGLKRFITLPVPRGYILGQRSDTARHEAAALVATAGIPVATVPNSGHVFPEENPSGFAEAIASLLPHG